MKQSIENWKIEKEIEKQVYEKYPVSKAERRCQNEKMIMDRLRNVFRKKLIEGREKQEKIR